MSIVCCSTGKARVFYQIPRSGGFKIRLKGETKWITYPAAEKVTFACTDKNPFQGGQVQNKLYKVSYAGNSVNWGAINNYLIFTGPIGQIQAFTPDNDVLIPTGQGLKNLRGPAGDKYIWWGGVIRNGSFRYVDNGNIWITTVEREDGTPLAQDIEESGPSKQFKVIGAETGYTYLDITVDECPDVQTFACIFDVKNTQSIDIELPKKTIPWVSLPSSWIPLMNGYKPFITLDSCIKIVDDSIDKAIEIWIVYTAPGSAIEFDPFNLTGWNKKVKSIPYPKGCPPPKAWVECCPNGICGEDKKCPKETVCQVDCEGFRCCYDGKGNLIKKIKL